MPLYQYVYFGLHSAQTSADEMTALLNIEPDEVLVRGSRYTEPRMIPVRHSWKVVCREPGLRVDEQVSRVLDRLRPHTDRIGALARRLATKEGGGAVLEIVRYFNDDDPRRHPTPSDTADAPNLFGWHLDRDALDFLTAVGAVLDIDEYDMTLDHG